MIEGSLLRILITRLSAVGDCIHTLPLATAIRARYPRAMIAWCVESGAAPLVKAHPAVNRVVVLKKGWLKSPAMVWKARSELQALQCEIAIDPQSLTKSATAAWLSGARRRIGFAAPQGRELAPWLHTDRIVAQSPHVVDKYLELLAPLEIVNEPVRFGFLPDAASVAVVEQFLDAQRLHRGFVVMNPGAGWDSKLWPADRYAKVTRHLGQWSRLKSVIAWAGKRELEWAERIVALSDGHAILAPKTSLLELAALVKAAMMFVGSDTGPMHLAAAMNVPCVAMYGPTRPEECGPYGVGHAPLQISYHAGTARERRSADNRAMCAIRVEDVCHACERILARYNASATQRRAA
ncbi:MAG TPA: glycosyltransferase family 9 protein [Pirellulaceae bacterium]|nr:glycosyltransferase family 9 protein [Pirellulaceae bacterium]